MTLDEPGPPAASLEEKVAFDRALQALVPYARTLSRAMGLSGDDDLLHDYYVARGAQHAARVAAMPEGERAPWLRTTLRHYAIDRLRASHREQRALQSWGQAIEARGEAPPLEGERAVVTEALEALPTLERRIIEGTFGLEGEARSERSLGREMSLDRHEVRRRLVDGLLQMVVRHGDASLLTPEQVAVCRLVLLSGCGVAEAGARLGIGTSAARSALKQARAIMEKTR